MEMNIDEILEVLPHRQPFLLVDRVIECEPGVKIKGYKNITYNEPFFAGHFPSKPVMPGVLMIEAMAQLGAIAVLMAPEYKGKIAFLGGVDKAKFRGNVVPGDRLDMECEIVKVKGPIGIGSCKAYVGDKQVCRALITFAIG